MKPSSGDAASHAGLKAEAVSAAPKAEGAERPRRPTVPASFRLDPVAISALRERAQAAGISPRSWLEKNLLELPDAYIVARRHEHPDLGRLLFQVSRAGNNLNQIAYKLNRLDQVGELTAADVRDGTAALRDVSILLHRALRRAG